MNGFLANLFANLTAMSETGLDGLQAPWPYSPLVALGLFVGIPLAFIGLTFLVVYGTSWTRSGRSTAEQSGEPTWMSSPAASMTAPAGPGTQLPAGSGSDTGEHGGTSARW